VTPDIVTVAAFTAFCLLTFTVGALAGCIGGYFAGRPGEAEKKRAQAELDACYDAGYADGYNNASEDALDELASLDA
jgi:hypothetical protein